MISVIVAESSCGRGRVATTRVWYGSSATWVELPRQLHCGVSSVQNANELPRGSLELEGRDAGGSIALAVIVTLPLTRALFTGLATE